MENSKQTDSATTQSSGSAEQTGRSRGEQKNQDFQLDDNKKSNVASDINVSKDHIAGLHDLGVTSGRDDYAGGSGDNMTRESTNEPTDH